jgi:hypothetical protein
MLLIWIISGVEKRDEIKNVSNEKNPDKSIQQLYKNVCNCGTGQSITVLINCAFVGQL